MPAASELPRKWAKTFSRTKPEMRVRKMPAATRTANPPRGLAEFTSDTERKIPALRCCHPEPRRRRRIRGPLARRNFNGSFGVCAPQDDRKMSQQPIRIAGAGPSGLAAAIVLARAGRKVEVHEAKRDVGMRFIGDLQVIEGASEAEGVPDFLDRTGIERNFYFRAASWGTFYDHHRVARVIRSAEPYGYFIRRGAEEGTLDRGLLAQARAAGAKVIFNSRLDVGRTLSPAGRVEEPAPRAEADIIATGPASPDGLAREMTWRS